MKKTVCLILTTLFVVCVAKAAELKAWVEFANSAQQNLNMSHFMKNDPNDEPYTYFATKDNRGCICIPTGKYGYFMVDRSVVPSSVHQLIFKVTYWNEGNGEMKLQYNGTNGQNYVDAKIQKTGTREWMTVTMAVNDASFRRAQNQSADFRINDNNYIARVEIYEGTMDPLSEPAITHHSGTEFIGKSVAGYQCWFKVGGQTDFWHHWGNDYIAPDQTRWPRQYNHTFEIYPDVRDYPFSALAQTGFSALGNGESSVLYRSEDSAVIASHFAMMAQNGIDGVAVQRFIGSEMKSVVQTAQCHLKKIQHSAEENSRLFYICYDISSNGLETTWADLIKFDWVYNIEQNNALTQSPSYATVNGQPVVEIWGIGFTDRPGDAARTQSLIDFLHSRGCYVIGGVPTYWRENRNDARPASDGYTDVYTSCDMLSPWYVGRFSNESEYQYFIGLMNADVTYCRQHQVDYMPVLFAGFGWATWNSGSINQAPRLAGKFMWKQVQEIKNAGCTNMYFAMFDEYDEGTAILKAAEDWTMIPTDSYFLTMSADGIWCSSDFYLRLAGAATRVLKGQQTLTTDVPVPYSLGPVYYRNSFEQKRTRYNMVNGQYQSEGVFPVDPCLYGDQTIRGNASYALNNTVHRSGEYSLQVTGTLHGNDYLMQFSQTKIEISSALSLSAYVQVSPVTNSVQLAALVGNTWYYSPAVSSATWQPTALVLPASCIGQTVTAIGVCVRGDGDYTAFIDDVLVEQTGQEPSALPVVERTASVEKILHQHSVYILKNGRYYDLLGNARQRH